MLKIEEIRSLCKDETIVATEHLITRMRQRKIKWEDIKNSIKNGEILKQYPADYPFPSCLINGDNLHIVCSIGEGYLYIITTYRPSIEIWDNEGRIKRGDKS